MYREGCFPSEFVLGVLRSKVGLVLECHGMPLILVTLGRQDSIGSVSSLLRCNEVVVMVLESLIVRAMWLRAAGLLVQIKTNAIGIIIWLTVALRED